MIYILFITAIVSILGLTYPSIISTLCINPTEPMTWRNLHRYITHAFVHKSWHHLLTNIVALLYLYTKLRPTLDGTMVGCIYLLAVCIAGIFYTYCGNCTHSAIGSSGGAYGLLLFAIAIGTSFIIPTTILACILLIMLLLEMQTHQSFYAHLGGALVGYLIAVAYLLDTPSAIQLSTHCILAIGFIVILKIDIYNRFKKH